MKYCSSCATPVEPDDLYCPVCGTKLGTFSLGEAACGKCGSLIIRVGMHARCPNCDSYCADCGCLVTEKMAQCPECKVSFKKDPRKRFLSRFPKDHPLYKELSYAEYAGPVVRLLSSAADIIIMAAIVSVVGVLIGVRFGELQFWTLVLAFLFLYETALVSGQGGTLGMHFFSMRVVKSDARRPGIVRAAARFLAGILSTATLLGMAMIGFHSYRQGLHDLLLNTFVIRIKE